MRKYCKFRQKYYNYSYNGTIALSETTEFLPNGSKLSLLQSDKVNKNTLVSPLLCNRTISIKLKDIFLELRGMGLISLLGNKMEFTIKLN